MKMTQQLLQAAERSFEIAKKNGFRGKFQRDFLPKFLQKKEMRGKKQEDNNCFDFFVMQKKVREFILNNKNFKEILDKMDGKLYERNDERTRTGYALRWKSGAFYYCDELVILAERAGFARGSNVPVYTRMPWGMQHISYEFKAR